MSTIKYMYDASLQSVAEFFKPFFHISSVQMFSVSKYLHIRTYFIYSFDGHKWYSNVTNKKRTTSRFSQMIELFINTGLHMVLVASWCQVDRCVAKGHFVCRVPPYIGYFSAQNSIYEFKAKTWAGLQEKSMLSSSYFLVRTSPSTDY